MAPGRKPQLGKRPAAVAHFHHPFGLGMGHVVGKSFPVSEPSPPATPQNAQIPQPLKLLPAPHKAGQSPALLQPMPGGISHRGQISLHVTSSRAV